MASCRRREAAESRKSTFMCDLGRPSFLVALYVTATLTLCCVHGFVLPMRPSQGGDVRFQRRSWRQRDVSVLSTTQEPGSEAPGDSMPLGARPVAPNSAGGKGFGPTSTPTRAKIGTVNKRLMNVIDAELDGVRDRQPEEATPLSEEDTDLNGINPVQPLGAAMFAAFISLLFWRITFGLAGALNNVHLDTDFYPAQRVFGIASTAFVGITALGAGVIGVTAIGLLGLAVRVTFGVVSGELDMNKKKIAPPADSSPVPLDAQGLPKVTGAWYDVSPPAPSAEEPKD